MADHLDIWLPLAPTQVKVPRIGREYAIVRPRPRKMRSTVTDGEGVEVVWRHMAEQPPAALCDGIGEALEIGASSDVYLREPSHSSANFPSVRCPRSLHRLQAATSFHPTRYLNEASRCSVVGTTRWLSKVR